MTEAARVPAGALVFVLLIAVSFGAFYPTTRWMWSQWATAAGHFSHGFVVLGMACYLVWRLQPALAGPLTRPSRGGVIGWLRLTAMVCLPALCVVWLVAWLTHTAKAEVALLFAFIAGAGVLLFGIGWRIVWPLALFALAFPMWDPLAVPLQQIAAKMVTALVRLLSIPAYIEGNQITLAQGSFIVARGCSGLNFVLSSMCLSLFFACLAGYHWTRVVRTIAIATLIAMAANWIRITIIVVWGYATDMQTSLIDDHLWLGWVVFALLCFPYIYVATAGDGADPALGPHDSAFRISRAAPLWVLTVAAGTALAVFGLRGADGHGTKWGIDLDALAGGTPGEVWHRPPRFEGADAYGERTVAIGGRRSAVLHAVAYVTEAQGKELVFEENDVLAGARGANLGEQVTELGRTRIVRAQDRDVVVAWSYLVGGRFYVRSLPAKMAQVRQRLRGRTGDAALVLWTHCDGDCERAGELAAEYLQARTIAFDVDTGRVRVE